MSSTSLPVLFPERIPESGTLVIPSRLNFEQLLQIEKLFAHRSITWLVEESSHHDPAMLGYLEKSRSGAMFSCRDTAPEAVGKQLASHLSAKGVLIYVPGRATARHASLCHVPGGHLRSLCAFGLPVLPIAVICPRESALSTERVSHLPPAVFAIGKPLDAKQSSAAGWWESALDAAESVFSSSPSLDGSLGMTLLQAIKKHGTSGRIFDGADDSELTYDKILAVALAFSRHIRQETDQERVAIVLPPGKAGLIANLAVILAGKTPVNLNFTAGPESVRSCVRQSGVDRFITADPFVRKVPGFPWPPNRDLILVERVIPSLRKKIVQWGIIARLAPAKLLGRFLGLHKRRGDQEAALLFTSGSSGEPKGVVLSHRNVLCNVLQFSSRLDMGQNGTVLGCLPLFHSFGFTVTLWYPLIQGVNVVTYPSPLETRRLAELIALHQVHLLLSTPTFLRGYMKRIDPAQLASLKLVITGAEKLPQSLADAFEERFGIRPQEGYGLTETSPATNVNLPDPPADHDAIVIPSSRRGSVGVMLPGIAVRLTDPATDQPVPLDHQGIIWLRGSNIFQGYLKQPQKTSEVLKDGWFRTGDVGRMDEDGFLYIEGRISRFSKIGGEMVPHETVEAAVLKVLELDGDTERRIAIVGIPDEQKGESIVLLSTIAGPALEQECIDLRYKLLDHGLPSLWCPKAIIPVPEIPVLASGKLDIKACESLARR